MKRAAFIVLCFAAGLGLSRLTPRAAMPPAAVSMPPAAVSQEMPKPAPTAEAPVYSLAGDWRPSVEDWAAKDPSAFHQWLLEHGTPPDPEVLRVLFREWAGQDAETAFSAVFNLPVDFKREDHLLDGMLAQVLKQPGGLETALKWIPSVVEQISGWGHPEKEWLKSAPTEEIASLLAAKAGGSGYAGTMIWEFTRHWAAQDHDAAMAWMNTLNPKQRGNAVQGLMEAWSKTDPQAAMDYLASDQATTEDRFNAYQPMAGLAKTDPKAALDWWEANIGVTNSNSLRQVYQIWGKAAPAEALNYAQTIEDPVLRRESLEAWGNSMKTPEVIRAIGSQPPGPDRRALLDSLSGNYNHDPGATGTIRSFVADPANNDISTNMVYRVSSTYASSDPQAALDWAASLPESRRNPGVQAVLLNWPDKVAAAQAVENLPPGPVREAVLQALAKP